MKSLSTLLVLNIKMNKKYFSAHGGFFSLTLWVALSGASHCYADGWHYQQLSDPLTNQSYSLAQSPRPDRNLYDNIKLQIVCKQQQLQAVVEAESLIESQNSPFVVDYQIDQGDAVKLTFTTFADAKRRGYTNEDAKRIADDLLAGKKVFVRIYTLIKKVLSAEMLLDDAQPAIAKVFADCGVAANTNGNAAMAYGLGQFEQDFAKLNPQQQLQVLAKIKKIMMELP